MFGSFPFRFFISKSYTACYDRFEFMRGIGSFGSTDTLDALVFSFISFFRFEMRITRFAIY